MGLLFTRWGGYWAWDPVKCVLFLANGDSPCPTFSQQGYLWPEGLKLQRRPLLCSHILPPSNQKRGAGSSCVLRRALGPCSLWRCMCILISPQLWLWQKRRFGGDGHGQVGFGPDGGSRGVVSYYSDGFCWHHVSCCPSNLWDRKSCWKLFAKFSSTPFFSYSY